MKRPLPTATSQSFFDAAAAGRLSFPRCPGCGAWQSYPRPYCPVCLGDDLELVAIAGTGTVHAATVVHRAIVGAFAEQIPYIHALVDLDEGIRVVSMIIDCPPDVVRPGLPVAAVIDLPPDETDGPSTPLILFRPRCSSARSWPPVGHQLQRPPWTDRHWVDEPGRQSGRSVDGG